MERNAIKQLSAWKNNPNKKPLIIRGARQVGKTWLMIDFAKKYYKQYAYINFDGNKRMAELFGGDYDIKRILEGLSIERGLKINAQDTLIIFDEVQECPRALTALKYFYENAPQYNIIAAGSLLGLALHEGTSFPVGKVDFMDLYPLSFSEFLLALGMDSFVKLLEENNFPTIKTFKDKYADALRRYYYIGGMPEVVSTFAKNQDYVEVRKLQNNILEAYAQDFSKHINTTLVTKVRMVWNSLPGQLSKENKKFIYGVMKSGARAKEYESALTWLMDCGLIYKVNRVRKPDIPLKSYEDLAAFKIFIVDVGLLSALSGLDAKTLLEGNKIFEEFKGALSEQYVLQELKAAGQKDVFYWSKETSAELDFLMQLENNIVPIEVKAETNLKAKSLKVYREEYSPAVAVRFSMSDYKKTDSIYDIPLYMAQYAFNIIKD